MKGRKRGSLIEGSVQHRISLMQPGDTVWVETTAGDYAKVQREWNLPKSRRNELTRDFEMVCSVWQALPVGKLGAPTILVKVERKS